MAEFFCDHGSTLYPTAYMSVPAGAGSFPQDGDGAASGSGAAPAPAVATMNFSAATAAAGAAFAVHGATLTCVASGATTNQFNAGSGATLAANIASAINAATALPTTTTGGTAPYLRALVWAVASGAVLTVYTRIASAALNQSANPSCTLLCGTLGNWTSPPAAANFAGGVSGPWSRLFNPAALTASASAAMSAAGTYGAVIATPMGAPGAGDVVHIRTARAGANIQVTGIGGVSMTAITRQVGTPDAYVEYRFDNGVVWPGENGIFGLQHDTTGAAPTLIGGGYTYWRGQMQNGTLATSGGQPNCRFQSTVNNGAGWAANFVLTSGLGARHCVAECIEAVDAGIGSFLSGGWVIATAGNTALSALTDLHRPPRIVNSRLGSVRANQAPFATTASAGLCVELVDCHMAYGGATTYTAALCTATAINSAINIRMLRPRFTGGGGGHHTLIGVLQGMTVAVSLVIDDPVEMGQFQSGDSAASLCGRLLGGVQPVGAPDITFVQAVNSEREFLLDTPRRLVEWRQAGFPTTGLSVLADGTPYTLRMSTPHTGLGTGLVTRMAPQRGIKQVAVNTLGNTNLTLTHHILIDSQWGGSAYTPTDAEWWIEGAYTDSTGAVKTFSTRGGGTALTADTQAWSALSFAPFAGAARSYSRWVFAVALADVKANSLVTCYLVCGAQPQTMVEWAFIDPEPVLAVAP